MTDAGSALSQRGMAHHPGLDGVRASALLMIMLYHADPSWIPGGFISVSLFFTLSGYLITSLLVFEGEREGNVSLGSFWSRRLRRLLPAAVVTLLVVVFLSTWLDSSVGQGRVRGDAVAAAAYVANWRSIFAHHSYAELFADASPLQHLWSLSIEEQLYVLVPVVVFGCFLVGLKRRGIGVVFLVLSAASVLVAVLVNGKDRIYYGTDTRAVELFVGAAMACFVAPRMERWAESSRRWWSPLLLAPLVAFIWFSRIVDGQSAWLYTGLLGVFALLNVVFVVGAVVPGPMRWVMSLSPLTLMGRLSYGIYLIHWPVYVWLDRDVVDWSPFPLLVLRWLVIFALAGLLYNLVEMPIRQRRVLKANVPAALLAIGSVAAVIAVPLLVLASPSSAVSTEQKTLATVAPTTTEPTVVSTTATGPSTTSTLPPPIDRSKPINMLVIGDSSAVNVALALANGSSGDMGIISGGVIGCPLPKVALVYRRVDENQETGYCPDNVERVRENLTAIDAVLIVASVANQWAYDPVDGGPKVEVGSEQYNDNLDAFIEQVGEVVSERGVQVIVLESPEVRDDRMMNGDTPFDSAAWNMVMQRWDKRYQWVTVVKYEDLLAPADSDEGRAQRPDGTHLDEAFGQTLAREGLTPRIREAYFDAVDEMNATGCRVKRDGRTTLVLDACS